MNTEVKPRLRHGHVVTGLSEILEDLFGVPVDIVSEIALHPLMNDEVLKSWYRYKVSPVVLSEMQTDGDPKVE